MTLNVTIEVIFDLLVSSFSLVGAILILFLRDIRKIKSLVWISLNLFITSASYLCQALSILFLNYPLHAVHSIGIFVNILIFVVGFNYITKESYLSISVLITMSIGVLYLYFAFQWENYEIILDYGFPVIAMKGFLLLNWNLLILLISLQIVIWSLKIKRNSPFMIKRGVYFFYMGVIIYTCVMAAIYLLSGLINPAIVYLTDDIFGGAIIVLICFIASQPQLLYTLPFTIYRIVVKDKDGAPLFEHDWSLLGKKEMVIFAGFLNAMKVMSEKVLQIGEPVEVKLQKGILIIQDSELITVGLVASRSSKFLRETLAKFSIAFEQKFEKPLKRNEKSVEIYKPAFELIQIYFSNFAHKLLIDTKSPLLLPTEIPKELETKLKNTINDDYEYQSIKSEIFQAPIGIITDFISLHDELTQELLQEKKKDINLLENKKQED
ncbi:MAG: hypothetical protein ACFFAS_06695 [Promethearchaeota archaeon]